MVRNTPAEIKDGANYAIYCFGAAPVSNSNDYKFLDEEIQALDTYLKGIDSNIPVFVLSHYPLHNSGGRTIQNVDGVIRVLKKNSFSMRKTSYCGILVEVWRPHYQKQ